MTPTSEPGYSLLWALNLLRAGLTDYAAEVALPATGHAGATARALLARGNTADAIQALAQQLRDAPTCPVCSLPPHATCRRLRCPRPATPTEDEA